MICLKKERKKCTKGFALGTRFRPRYAYRTARARISFRSNSHRKANVALRFWEQKCTYKDKRYCLFNSPIEISEIRIMIILFGRDNFQKRSEFNGSFYFLWILVMLCFRPRLAVSIAREQRGVLRGKVLARFFRHFLTSIKKWHSVISPINQNLKIFY